MHPRLDFSMGDSQTYSNCVELSWLWFCFGQSLAALKLISQSLCNVVGKNFRDLILSQWNSNSTTIHYTAHICQQMVIIDHHKITIYRNQLLDILTFSKLHKKFFPKISCFHSYIRTRVQSLTWVCFLICLTPQSSGNL